MAGAGYLGHRFQVYLDLLGAPNQIQVRRYKDEYFVVITPSPQPQIGDIRQAYLHFLIEPLAAKYADDLKTKSALADYAGAAPLDPHYKDDFFLLATKSLVKAVEGRMAGSRGPAMVEAALREGYILAPHFSEQLALYEAQEQAMRLYFPELIKSIDLKKEERRLEKVEFASALAVRKAKAAPVPAQLEPQLTGAAKTADDAERLYRERNLEAARQHFTRLLSETDERAMQARAYYGLARIATLEKNPELAEKLFQKTLELEPEAQVKSWAYVYLGRLSDLAGEREQATRNYQAALAVEGASPGAREAAEKGIKESFPRT
jgi:tetratricopeptide (TPR) repeat protein